MHEPADGWFHEPPAQVRGLQPLAPKLRNRHAHAGRERDKGGDGWAPLYCVLSPAWLWRVGKMDGAFWTTTWEVLSPKTPPTRFIPPADRTCAGSHEAREHRGRRPGVLTTCGLDSGGRLKNR